MRPCVRIFISVAAAAFFLAADGLFCVSSADYSQLDSLTGLNQSFTVDNRFDTFSDNFRAEQVAEPLKESAVSDKEKRKELDLWKYSHSLHYGGLYSRTSNNDPDGGSYDFVHTVSPGVGMARRSDHTYVALFYDISMARHVQDTEANTVNHAQKTVLAYNFSKLQLTFSNTIRPSSAYAIGTRTELQADQGSASKVSVYNNDFSMKIDYDYTPKTQLALTYTNSLFYFPVPEGGEDGSGNNAFSTITHRVTPEISYILSPKMKVFADYTFGVDDYFEGGRFSSTTNQPEIGFSGRLNPKTRYSTSLGYVFKDYEDRSIRDWDQVSVSAALFRKITPKIDGSLTYSFQPQERLSASGDQELYADVQFLGLAAHWAATRKIGLSAFAKVGWVSQEGHITQADTENPDISHTRPEESDTYSFGLSASWSPRRFVNLSIAYDYSNANASFKNDESDTHRLGGTVGLTF